MPADGFEHLLLLSDTHGQLDSRILGLARKAQLVVHAGDIGDAGVLQQLAEHTRVVAIRGNNDVPAKWPAHDHGILSDLPDEVELEVAGGTLVVVHGHRAGKVDRRHEFLRERYRHARAVLYGHSHKMICDRTASPWILNPGAAGRMRTCGGPSCLLLTANRRRWLVKEMRFELRPQGSE